MPPPLDSKDIQAVRRIENSLRRLDDLNRGIEQAQTRETKVGAEVAELQKRKTALETQIQNDLDRLKGVQGG